MNKFQSFINNTAQPYFDMVIMGDYHVNVLVNQFTKLYHFTAVHADANAPIHKFEQRIVDDSFTRALRETDIKAYQKFINNLVGNVVTVSFDDDDLPHIDDNDTLRGNLFKYLSNPHDAVLGNVNQEVIIGFVRDLVAQLTGEGLTVLSLIIITVGALQHMLNVYELTPIF